MTSVGFGRDSTGGFSEALVYGANNGARISSNSWGYDVPDEFDQDELEAIDYAVEQGVIVVFAAGNDDSDDCYYPGCYDKVVAVAAVDNEGVRADFSNYGDWVDIAAPGVDIWSTVSVDDGYFNPYSGSSMACPHVAGLLALGMALNPVQSVNETIGCLMSTATNIDGKNTEYEMQLGVGMIDALEFVTCIRTAPVPTITPIPTLSTMPTPTPTKTLTSSSTGAKAAAEMPVARTAAEKQVPLQEEEPTPQVLHAQAAGRPAAQVAVQGTAETKAAVGYAYIGCYADAEDRDVSYFAGIDDVSMTATYCAGSCASYLFFATQNSGECRCGNSYGGYGDSSGCTSPCTGDSTEMCGGAWANSVYSISAVPSVLPTTLPTTVPSAVPSALPTAVPSTVPSTLPTAVPKTTEGQWELIVSQTDAATNLFPSETINTMLHNENDDSSNPFMSLGSLDWDSYRGEDDGLLTFQVQWIGGDVDGEISTWKQSNIPSETNVITDFEYGEGSASTEGSCAGFQGAGLSDYLHKCVIDGSGEGRCWWNCLAAVGCFAPYCIPAMNGLTATGVKLFIWSPGYGNSATSDPYSYSYSFGDGDGGQNGEVACENHGFNETECALVGCCGWDDKQCWTAVGTRACASASNSATSYSYSYSYSFDDGDGATASPSGMQSSVPSISPSHILIPSSSPSAIPSTVSKKPTSFPSYSLPIVTSVYLTTSKGSEVNPSAKQYIW
eukprot:CAMPEP_0185793144 /NCGR_PEP_ID=MMETSP1174-20130828/159310_1 /TAXON_ID=35687 /ORGANISM="Dictyocha speculum, Strain CCMP1381" /LENGTH=725 /DNA_ID=CAMNT_0028488261 /DNA_START=1161 /DNA_END=3335 /DNA_ORIENTATION=-